MTWSLKLMQFFLKPAGCSSRGHDAEWNGRCWETLPGAFSLCRPRFLVGFRWGKKKAHNLHLSPTFELTWISCGTFKQLQAAEVRYEELVTRMPDSTRPLLRQIEALQVSRFPGTAVPHCILDQCQWIRHIGGDLHIAHFIFIIFLWAAQFLRCRNQQQWEQRHGQVLSVHSTLAFRYQKSIFVYKKKTLTSL
jgi:hypothetical protein